jgi:hypothetical protein
MASNTLYYLLSTIAQVMAAVSALLAIFSQFKINELKDSLIGDGKSIYNRMIQNEPGYEVPNGKIRYVGRLRDSIDRRSITGIEEIIDLYLDLKIKNGETLESNPRGFIKLKELFVKKKEQVYSIKTLTKNAIIISFTTIFLTIINLVFVEAIICNWLIYLTVIISTTLMATISMIISIKGVYKGLKDHDEI